MRHLTWLTCGGMGYARPLKFLLWQNHMSGSTLKVSATTCNADASPAAMHLEPGLSID